MRSSQFAFIAATGVLLATSSVVAANWPSWRGPSHDGVTEEKNLPVEWSSTKNVKWKTPLPDRGNSTPVIWGDKLFLTQATKDDKRSLFCFDKNSGKLLWQTGITCTDHEPTHATNPYCSASPATDGQRVIVSYGSAVYCYDLDGKKLWHRDDLGKQKHIWGNASSPVIAGDFVYLNFGPGDPTILYSFDKKTGKTMWLHREPGGNSGEGGGKSWLGAWCDPLPIKADTRGELVMAYPGHVVSFEPANGKILWTCEGLTPLSYNTPLHADGLIVAMCGYNGSALAVNAGGSGDVTAQRVWLQPKVSQRIGSGVLYEGYHYILTDGGIAECRNLKSGEFVFSERLKGPGPTANNWSSLVRSGDKLYAVNQGGDAFVFRAAPTFELLATNSIGEKTIASIAVSDGHLYIRSYQNLWCIGE